MCAWNHRFCNWLRSVVLSGVKWLAGRPEVDGYCTCCYCKCKWCEYKRFRVVHRTAEFTADRISRKWHLTLRGQRLHGPGPLSTFCVDLHLHSVWVASKRGLLRSVGCFEALTDPRGQIVRTAGRTRWICCENTGWKHGRRTRRTSLLWQLLYECDVWRWWDAGWGTLDAGIAASGRYVRVRVSECVWVWGVRCVWVRVCECECECECEWVWCVWVWCEWVWCESVVWVCECVWVWCECECECEWEWVRVCECESVECESVSVVRVWVWVCVWVWVSVSCECECECCVSAVWVLCECECWVCVSAVWCCVMLCDAV